MEAGAASGASGHSVPATSWAEALTQGHRHVRLADRLLQRAWMMPVPFPVMTAGHGGTVEVVSEDSAYCEMIVVALFWNSGMSPDSLPTGVLLAVPEAAAHGVEHVMIVDSPTYYMDGTYVCDVRVAVILASPAYVGQYLTETSPADAIAVSFVEDSVGALPWNAHLFGQLDLPDTLNNGHWVHMSMERAAVRVLTNGNVSDEEFASLPEQEDNGQLVVTEVLNPDPSTRRAVNHSRRPSVAGLGSSAKLLGAVLSKAPVSKHGVTPKAKAKGGSKAKAPPPAIADRDLLHQVLASVQALGDRITHLESGISAPAPHMLSTASSPGCAAFPISSSPALPSLHSPMPAMSSSGMTMPLSSLGMTMPMSNSELSVPKASSGMAMPMSSSGMSMPCLPSSAKVLDPSLAAAGALPKGAQSLLYPPPGMLGQSPAYRDALTEARRLLGGVVSVPHAEPDVTGARGARERAVDVEVREAVMRGGADAQVAMNLAFLECLDRVGKKPGVAAPDDG
eukprot:4273803-Amphidinium_carterae.1